MHMVTYNNRPMGQNEKVYRLEEKLGKLKCEKNMCPTRSENHIDIERRMEHIEKY